jgi:hypothetical protein
MKNDENRKYGRRHKQYERKRQECIERMPLREHFPTQAHFYYPARRHDRRPVNNVNNFKSPGTGFVSSVMFRKKTEKVHVMKYVCEGSVHTSQ